MSSQPKPEKGSEHIKLTVVGIDNIEVQFKVKKSTSMGKLMVSYAERKGVPAKYLRFFFDDHRIAGTDTPKMLELEDGDVIDVFSEQEGGSE